SFNSIPAWSSVLFAQPTGDLNCSKVRGGILMPAKKKSTRRRYSQGASKTVASAMRGRKRGTLKSGKGGKGGTVESRKQAIAIGLSEARKKGARVPRKKK